ncbi:sensor histidine kinase [Amycolatopsis sp. NPDC059657]|uniref:sensor histidine kinase n=1 Tax=Amycolatopsis sp. NPDC059657 TaxID=3346899 RepID=UPI00366FE783
MTAEPMPPWLAGRLGRPWLIAFDLVATAILLVATAGNTAAETWDFTVSVPRWVAWVLAAAVVVPVATRRVWPWFAFGFSLVVPFPAILVGGPVSGLASVAMAFALYPLAATLPRRRSLTALGVAFAVVIVTNLVFTSLATLAVITFGAAMLTLAWTTGRASLERREFATEAAESYARQAVSEERLRIAREMHDVVAHSMSLIAVKAAVGNHVAAEQPEEARDALRVIENTSRDALAEMRRMLGVLRSGEDAPELGPAPDASSLDGLAERAAMAGVQVELTASGVDDLPDGVGLSVYRIVQEALTNVVKHAAPASARVTVAADGESVTIEVTDNGSARLPGPPGHGLIGMRERVMVYDGEFAAGPRPESGFRVFAKLPYEAAR